MAYRRSITTKVKLYSHHRFTPSFSYVHNDDEHRNHQPLNQVSKFNDFIQTRSIAGTMNTSLGFGAPFRDRRWSQFGSPTMMSGSFLARHMSTNIGEEAGKIDYITDVADVLTEKTVEAVTSQVPAMSEVAIAAADSWLPVAGLQYFIDGIHNLTGLNWWASIVITTLVIRGLTIPIMINQLKATSKLTLMKPRLEEIKQEMEDRGMSPSAVADYQAKSSKLFKEYGVKPLTPIKGILIQGPVFLSFFLAIQNMVEKVPSFKDGGIFWFTDLTTPDALYILPVLTALTFWITVECNMLEGFEGNSAAGTMKNVSRGFAVLTVPITMTFPKAIFCYWITSNTFSFFYGLVIKRPAVRNFLGVPIIPVGPPSTKNSRSSFSFFEMMKKYMEAQKQPSLPPPSPQVEPKPTLTRLPPSSHLSQRIKTLERQVKGRKKNKRR